MFSLSASMCIKGSVEEQNSRRHGGSNRRCLKKQGVYTQGSATVNLIAAKRG